MALKHINVYFTMWKFRKAVNNKKRKYESVNETVMFRKKTKSNFVVVSYPIHYGVAPS